MGCIFKLPGHGSPPLEGYVSGGSNLVHVQEKGVPGRDKNRSRCPGRGCFMI